VKALATIAHSPSDIGASIASGSFQTAGMVVIPCSIHSVSAIAYCQGDNLLTRAADVTLKERRKLVLVVRETPFHRGHLKSMLEATEAGALILPPMPAFYGRPKTLDDVINHTVGRVLDHFGLAHNLVGRWGRGSGRQEDRIVAHRQPGRADESGVFPSSQDIIPPSAGMGKRREARERAVQFLFQHDLNPPDDLDAAIEQFWESQGSAAIAVEKGNATWGEKTPTPAAHRRRGSRSPCLPNRSFAVHRTSR
jgi:4-hydroxy-3-polyprenylbenzoate decarboxylase